MCICLCESCVCMWNTCQYFHVCLQKRDNETWVCLPKTCMYLCVWCRNEPIFSPWVCSTACAQIYIRGCHPPEGPSSDRCRSGKHEQRCVVFMFEEVRGQRPTCKRHCYHCHRGWVLIGDTLYTRCEGKQLFPLFFPWDEGACWWWTKLLLCSAELLTSPPVEASTYSMH